MKFKKKFVDLPFDADSISDGANRKLIHPVTQSVQGLKSFAAYPLASTLPEASGDLVTKGRIDTSLAALPVTHAYTFTLTEEMLTAGSATLPIEITGNPLATRLKVEGSAGFIQASPVADANGFLVSGSTLDWSDNTQMFRARAGDLATVLYSGLTYVPAGTQIFTHFTDDATMATFDYWRVLYTSGEVGDDYLSPCTNAACLGRGASSIYYYPPDPDMASPYYVGGLIMTPVQALEGVTEWGLSFGGIYNAANNRTPIFGHFGITTLGESFSDSVFLSNFKTWTIEDLDTFAHEWSYLNNDIMLRVSTPSNGPGAETGGWDVLKSVSVRWNSGDDLVRGAVKIASGDFTGEEFPAADGTTFTVALENTGGTLSVSIELNETVYPLCSISGVTLQNPRAFFYDRNTGYPPMYYYWDGAQYVGSPVCMLDWLNFVMQ